MCSGMVRSEEHTSELQSQSNLVCRLLLEKKKQLPATDQRLRTYLVRTLRGKLTKLSFEVCVLISHRHHRDKHPKYFLCTDLTLSAQQILPIYQKRWPIEVDNFYVKRHLGLADFRVQSYA